MVNRFLLAYSLGISAALGVVMLMGMTSSPAQFDEISVHKINVLEPDGTIRMVVSGQQADPGFYANNEYYPREGRPAGLYFMNDEGTEVGGLIFSGNRQEDGRPFSMVHFSMDNYNQDQALVLRHIQDRGIVTGLLVNDVPLVEYDYDALAALDSLEGDERQQALDEIRETGVWDSRLRLFAGRSRDGDAGVFLNDAEGRHRLVIAVTESGEVKLQIYDEDGNVVRDLLDED